MSEDNRFDNIFMSVIQQKQGIDGFFETVFGFLRRNTDFFTDKTKAEKVIVESCKKQFIEHEEQSQKKKVEEEERQKRDEARKKKEEDARKKKEEEANLKKQQEGAEKTIEEKQPAKIQEEKKEEEKKEEENGEKGEKKEEEDKTPPPYGNGGTTDKYIWTQTLDELHMYIPCPEDTRAKDLIIEMESKTLFCAWKSKKDEPMLSDEWTEQIIADDSYFTLEEGEIHTYKGKFIHLSVTKWKNQNHWWDRALKKDAKIDTQKINPETSNLSDLDGETKGTVEKMMFDMRQKQAGKPTSDELKKQDMLGGFMKAHPEMDFTKCKFS